MAVILANVSTVPVDVVMSQEYGYLYIPETPSMIYRPQLCIGEDNNYELITLEEGTTLGRVIINQNFSTIQNYVNDMNTLKKLFDYQTNNISADITINYEDMAYENIYIIGADLNITIDFTNTDNIHGKIIRIINNDNYTVTINGISINTSLESFIIVYGELYGI